MALKNNWSLKIFTLLSLLSPALGAKIILPELMAKQALNNIRFFSHDARFTYYQKKSGSFNFSTNYQVKEILKGKDSTQYTVYSTPHRKKIIITQDEMFNTFYSLRAPLEIYVMDYGQFSARKMATGLSPKLHLNDEWLSYYNAQEKTIHFVNIKNDVLKFSIKLNNSINVYFIPQVVMLDENTVVYTDLSAGGEVGVLKMTKTTSKTDLLYKTKLPSVKVELCLADDKLITGEFGLNITNSQSAIYSSPLPLEDYTKRQLIYQSPLSDIGQMICDHTKNKVYFIKRFQENESLINDVVELDTVTKEEKLISQLGTLTSLINMDGTLLVYDKGKYFIAKGTIDFKNVDSLKSLPPEENMSTQSTSGQ